MSNVKVVKKDGTTSDHSLVWNPEKKIYEVFPKVEESELYWNSHRQIKIEYK